MPLVYKPLPAFAKIDFSNPLTKGLVFDWKPQGRSALNPKDLVTGDRAVVTNTPTSSLRKFGIGVDFGTTARYAWSNKARLSKYDRISFEVIYIRDGGGSNGYGGLFAHGDATTGLPWFQIHNDNGDAGWGQRYVFGYTNRERIFSTAYPTNGQVYHEIVTYDHTNYSNTPKVWRNGTLLSLTDRWNSAQTWTISGDDINIGDTFWTGGAEIWDGAIFLCRYWKRELKVNEVHTLFGNPGIIYGNSIILAKTPSAISTASVSPVEINLSVQAVTATYEAVLSASVSPLALSTTPTSTTASYVFEQIASVSPISLSTSITSTTATHEEVNSASVSPVIITSSVVSQTATYVQVETSTVEPVALTVSPVAQAATYVQTETASVSATQISASVASTTAIHIEVYDATVSPVITSITVATQSATYVQIETASVSPVALSITPIAVTAQYIEIWSASVSPLQLLLSVSEVTATYAGVYNATVAPIDTSLAIPSITASHDEAYSSTIDSIALSLTIPTVTASLGTSEFDAEISFITLNTTAIDVVPTYEAILSTEVLPIGINLIIPDVRLRGLWVDKLKDSSVWDFKDKILTSELLVFQNGDLIAFQDGDNVLLDLLTFSDWTEKTKTISTWSNNQKTLLPQYLIFQNDDLIVFQNDDNVITHESPSGNWSQKAKLASSWTLKEKLVADVLF